MNVTCQAGVRNPAEDMGGVFPAWQLGYEKEAPPANWARRSEKACPSVPGGHQRHKGAGVRAPVLAV